MKFVDIKNDIAFRKIFGNDKKKEILISFLNAVLHWEGDKRIQSITIANPFQMPILPNMKTSIIDVKATDFRGNTFIIEMQVADIIGMDKRLLYYTSKEYSQQIVSGEKYTELNPVIFIGIFDFLLALYVIQKTHNFKSKNGMLVNGSLTLYVVSYKSSTS